VAIETDPRRIGVCIGQRKPSLGVVKGGVEPVIRAVALLAVRWETCGNVVRIAGALIFRRVARIALRREALELSCGGARMARFAVHSGVRSDQREAVLVVANRRYRYPPAFDGVTRFTIRAELAAMNVCMAVRAFLAHIGKDELNVTLGAQHFLVHTAQRIPRFVVIKFRNATDGFPIEGSMTVLARNVEGAMRIASDRFLRRTMLLLTVGLERKQKKRDEQ